MTTIEEPVNEYECIHHLPIRTDKYELLDICLRDPTTTRCDGFNFNCVDYKSYRELRGSADTNDKAKVKE